MILMILMILMICLTQALEPYKDAGDGLALGTWAHPGQGEGWADLLELLEV